MRALPLLACALVLTACGSAESAAPALEEGNPHEAHEAHERELPATPADERDDDDMSLFLLELALEDQRGQPFQLSTLRGHPVLLTFFYASCQTMCPLILSEVRGVESALSEEARAELRVVVVTIDPAHDTAARLAEVAVERGLPPERWSLVRGSEDDVRTLASTLGMNYRPTPDGFAHGALLSVLDERGVVVTQSIGTGQPLEPLVSAITAIAERP